MEDPDRSCPASHRRCIERITQTWQTFLATRSDRLRHGGETEKVAEAIIEDLFTGVLDWSKGDLMYGVGYADIVVSHHLAKYLVIEVKRPGALFPGRRALENAVGQARRYAGEQKIPSVAATDGRYFYAADVGGGGLIDRIMVDLSSPDAPVELWNLSVYGIYRTPSGSVGRVQILAETSEESAQSQVEILLHPRYKLPAPCFAYVPDASRPGTWKLPYRLADGTVDPRRLPMAIQAILGNYRGTRVGGIPEAEMQAVLIRLARAAWSEGRMPPQALSPAPAYQQLALVLDQLGFSEQMVCNDTGS
jgi:hypothetical protein